MPSEVSALNNMAYRKPRNLFLVIFVGAVVFIYDVFKTVSTVLGVAFLIRFFLIQPFYVSGQSMEPTFSNNQYIIVDQISYRFRDPHRGDVIVFKYPKNIAFSFIKRIMALPGERVTIQNGNVNIYNEANPGGFRLTEEYIKSSPITDIIDTTLGENEYFVMGDNRPNSSDSRQWGVLPRHLIIGRVWVVLYPFEDFESVHTPVYSTNNKPAATLPTNVYNQLTPYN
ncbi:TPA: signal peptidase I [Patescibacteria group bacterium]|nr:signal peptidase I [Patescibacteria group bacterium]